MIVRAAPVNRVFGAKARAAPFIAALVPPGRRVWVELFAGSAAVTLWKEPHPSEHLNDRDGDIVNLFRCLRDKAQRARLAELVDLTPWSEAEWREARESYAHGVGEIDPARRAWLYLVRAWMGVAGDVHKATGFKFDRTASKQCTKVWNGLPARIAVAARRLKDVHLHQREARELVERFGALPDAVLFADPPYPRHTLGNRYDQNYRIDMSDAEHGALAAALAACKAATIVTMARGTVYDMALTAPAWRVLDLPVRGLANAIKIEHVFINFDPPGRLAFWADRCDARGDHHAAGRDPFVAAD